MRRFHGFALIVNTLLPLVVALGLIWGVRTVWTAFAEHLAPPIDRVVEDGRELAGEAADAVGVAAEAGREAVAEAEKVAATLAAINLPGNLKVPRIPRVMVPRVKSGCKPHQAFTRAKDCWETVDAVGGVKRGLKNVVDRVNVLGGAVGGVKRAVAGLREAATALTPLAARMREAQANFVAQAGKVAEARAAIRAETAKVEAVAFWFSVLLLPWLALSYLLWAWRRLTDGARMLLTGA